MPADEVQPGDSFRAAGTETINGPPTRQKVAVLKRQIGRFRGSVTVRYDRQYPDTPH
jgi:hypothetical protein